MTKTKLNIYCNIKYALLNSTWTRKLDCIPKTSGPETSVIISITWKA